MPCDTDASLEKRPALMPIRMASISLSIPMSKSYMYSIHSSDSHISAVSIRSKACVSNQLR